MSILALIRLAMLVFQIVKVAPDVIDLFQTIFGKWGKLTPMRVAREIPKLAEACERKLQELDLSPQEKVALDSVCPLLAYDVDFNTRRGVLA